MLDCMKRLMLHALACLCVGCSLLQAGTEDIDFESQVLPILREHCLECHGSEAQESQLRPGQHDRCAARW